MKASLAEALSLTQGENQANDARISPDQRWKGTGMRAGEAPRGVVARVRPMRTGTRARAMLRKTKISAETWSRAEGQVLAMEAGVERAMQYGVWVLPCLMLDCTRGERPDSA
eukprot:3850237-Rhodomonas_salina.1